MKTASEHNDSALKAFQFLNKPTPAGVACDKCATEMVYSDNVVLTSYPPQRRVHCPACNYQTTIYG